MDRRVGFGPRLAAAAVDLIMAAGIGLALGAVLGGVLGGGLGRALGGPAGDSAAVGASLGAVLGAMAAFGGSVFLYSLIEAFTGASPGKRVLGLQIGLEDGRAASIGVYAKRWAVKFSGTLLGLLSGAPGLHAAALLAPAAGALVFAGCFLVLGDKRQALHDLAAKTAVFRKRDLAA